MHGQNICIEQVSFAFGILDVYGIKMHSPQHLYVGRSQDMEDIAQVRRWCQEQFSDWHDPHVTQDIMARARNRQYGGSYSALYCDVREGLEDQYASSLTIDLFLESLRGEGNTIARMEICLLLETYPSHLWGHLFQDPRGIARLQADDRHFATLLKRYQQ